jgi:hypothetical protein
MDVTVQGHEWDVTWGSSTTPGFSVSPTPLHPGAQQLRSCQGLKGAADSAQRPQLKWNDVERRTCVHSRSWQNRMQFN